MIVRVPDILRERGMNDHRNKQPGTLFVGFVFCFSIHLANRKYKQLCFDQRTVV